MQVLAEPPHQTPCTRPTSAYLLFNNKSVGVICRRAKYVLLLSRDAYATSATA